MKIVIDYREPEEFYNELSHLGKSKDIIIEKSNLEIGDFHIFEDDESNLSLIIERKSLSDLLSSIKDGRYNEQSLRLESHQLPNHNIIYLLEGSIELQKNKLNKQIIYSSWFSLNYFKGFSVINSYNINQSINIIFNFADKLRREKDKKPYFSLEVQEKNNIPYSSVIKTSKKSNISKENILEIMLMQIPNISNNIAICISNKFKNIKNLIKSLEEDSNCLESLRVGNNENKRRLSNIVKTNLKEYILL